MATLRGRQSYYGHEPEYADAHSGFWYSSDGQVIRWMAFFGLISLFLAYMVLGYHHAKNRISKGLPPLAYHRWLINKRDRVRYDPTYQSPAVYYNHAAPPNPSGQYGMYPMPPPVYNTADLPPTYQPGGTKVDSSRHEPTRRRDETGEPSPAYQAPVGPTPAAVHANDTGASRNPFQPQARGSKTAST